MPSSQPYPRAQRVRFLDRRSELQTSKQRSCGSRFRFLEKAGFDPQIGKRVELGQDPVGFVDFLRRPYKFDVAI